MNALGKIALSIATFLIIDGIAAYANNRPPVPVLIKRRVEKELAEEAKRNKK